MHNVQMWDCLKAEAPFMGQFRPGGYLKNINSIVYRFYSICGKQRCVYVHILWLLEKYIFIMLRTDSTLKKWNCSLIPSNVLIKKSHKIVFFFKFSWRFISQMFKLKVLHRGFRGQNMQSYLDPKQYKNVVYRIHGSICVVPACSLIFDNAKYF